jgi:uncharacterized OB-fold protein
MSSTHCHRCSRLMAASLTVCPHCGTSQDAESRAASARMHRVTWLAVGAGAALGAAAGGLLFRGTEAFFIGLLVGLLLGRGLVALKYGW